MDANEVVVVGPLDHPFVIFLPFSEIMLFDRLFFDQEVERAVNRGLGNPLALPPEPLPKLIGREMLTRPGRQDLLGDRLAGVRELQVFLVKPLLEFAGRVFRHGFGGVVWELL